MEIVDRHIAREITVSADAVQYLDGTEILRTATALGVDGIEIRFGAATGDRADQRPATITWWWAR